MMKILVFEYVTSGGFNKKELPEALANEGLLMLRALVAALAKIGGLELTVMLDYRLLGSICLPGIQTVIIGREVDYLEQYVRLLKLADAVWPIAPEFDELLQTFCDLAEKEGKILLASTANAVSLTADKFKTYRHLCRHRIPTVETRRFDARSEFQGELIVKPVDGVGCAGSYIISRPEDVVEKGSALGESGRYIVQPHLPGKKTSLSCLFKQGKAWLLSVNLQQFKIVDSQYHLSEIIVNYSSDFDRYQPLVTKIGEAIPGLWGYIGIDLIETLEDVLVLEINPRLTTSFVGLDDALGINTAALVLQLLKGEPANKRKTDRRITVKIEQE